MAKFVWIPEVILSCLRPEIPLLGRLGEVSSLSVGVKKVKPFIGNEGGLRGVLVGQLLCLPEFMDSMELLLILGRVVNINSYEYIN